MGLDKGEMKWLYKYMNAKSFFGRLSLGLFFGARRGRKSPLTNERERFESDMREQFKKLKEKGISIPVFTL